MSNGPLLKPTQYGVDTDKGFISTETWSGKFKRKFKENPLVPIGTAATVGALVMSFVKMRQGQSQNMNYWMRARVVFQATTVAALAIGAYALGQTKQQKEAAARGDNEAVLAQAAQERAEFWDRLAAAEEAERQEGEMTAKPGRWFGMFSGGKGVDGGVEASLPAPSTVSSAHSREGDVHRPSQGGTVSTAPAGADKIRAPVSNAPEKSSWWSWPFGSGKKS